MNKNLITMIAIGGALTLAIILISLGGNGASNPSLNHNSVGQQNSGSQSQRAVEQGSRTLIDDDTILGDPNAPITLVEFGDYQCTFCTRFFFDTKDKIVTNYIDTGKVKYVFRDLAINGRESNYAAEASECADDQGFYWEYHDILFENREGYNVGVFKQDRLKEYASSLDGLDQERFDGCVDDRDHRQEVLDDTNDARSFGASGTPTFFVNGIRVVGAQPYSVFSQIFDSELDRLTN